MDDSASSEAGSVLAKREFQEPGFITAYCIGRSISQDFPVDVLGRNDAFCSDSLKRDIERETAIEDHSRRRTNEESISLDGHRDFRRRLGDPNIQDTFSF